MLILYSGRGDKGAAAMLILYNGRKIGGRAQRERGYLVGRVQIYLYWGKIRSGCVQIPDF